MKRSFLIATVIYLVVSFGLFLWSLANESTLSSDQTFFQLVYQGKTDPAFSDYRVPLLDHYVPFQFTNLLRAVISDPVMVYRMLLPFLVFAYLLACFWALRRWFGPSVWVVILPILTLVPRVALGSQYWGILMLGHAVHRAFLQPFLWIFFFLFFHFRDNPRKLSFLFFGLGIISALYPTQGVYFALTLLVTYFLLFGIRRKTFVLICIFGTFFLLGAIPHLAQNYSVGLNAEHLSPQLAAQYNDALRFRFAYTFYPDSLTTYTRSMLLDLFPLVLLAWYVIRRWKSLSDRTKSILRYAVRFALATLLVAFGMPILQDLYVHIFHARLFIFDQFGATKFIYLTLYVFAAVFFLSVLPQLQRRARVLLMSSAIVALLFLNFFSLQNPIRQFIPLATRAADVDAFFAPTCEWIRNKTPEDATLMTVDADFRLCAERKIWVNWKEGMVYLYAHTPSEFIGWYQRAKAQDEAYAVEDWEMLFSLAAANGVEVVVVKKPFVQRPLPEHPVLYENDGYALFDSLPFAR